MTHEIVLGGCSPTPLAHYLKALGVLRLVAEQADGDAAGRWEGERFVLRTGLNEEALSAFFLHAFRPSPIVAPWNGGSGFYPKDNRSALDAITNSTAQRFAGLRDAIAFSRRVVSDEALTESPKNEAKASFLGLVRSKAPDAMLVWLDAAILLSGEEPRYPPLLGTGGNDGRLDFTNNFMQRLVELMALDADTPTAAGEAWLRGALFGEPVADLVDAAIGQFFPGGAGGPNAGTGFEADSLINPWDFVLMLEGALLFAASTGRRLESHEGGALSYPFTVRPVGAGAGAASVRDEAPARAEMWLPLWDRYVRLAELRTLLAEGRATLGRRAARDGLDFSRAIAALGVDRGIGAFQRYGFLMRSGKAYLATPLNRVPVRRNADAALVDELERGGFLDRLRRLARDDGAPSRLQSLARRLEDALFDLARRAEPRTLQSVLRFLGDIEHVLGASRRGREAVPRPLAALSEAWVIKSDDGTHEFRIACALAALTPERLPVREYLAPVRWKNGRWEWDAASRLVAWHEGTLCDNLPPVLDRRIVEAERRQLEDKPFFSVFGASEQDVAGFLYATTDDQRVSQLVRGLSLTRIPRELPPITAGVEVLPAAFAILKPFFVTDATLRHLGLLAPDRRLPLPRSLPALLAAGRVIDAVTVAWRRLRSAGYPLPGQPSEPPSPAGLDGKRLLAALSIPMKTGDLARTLRRVTQPVHEAI